MKKFLIVFFLSGVFHWGLIAQVKVLNSSKDNKLIFLESTLKTIESPITFMNSLVSLEVNYLVNQEEIRKVNPVNLLPQPSFKLLDESPFFKIAPEEYPIWRQINNRLTPEKIPVWEAVKVAIPLN